MKRLALIFGAVVMALTLSGCVTDYVGQAEHNTQAEAKLWGWEAAVSTTPPQPTDGTYAPTVRYDCRGQGQACKVYLTTLRNPIFGAFSRDGVVDRDGDDIQGNRGSTTQSGNVPAAPAGRFHKAYTWIDSQPGTCEFFANLRQNFLGPAPGLALCFTAPTEEVDKDLDLQVDFGSLGDLFDQIWSGALASSFTIEMTAVELDGFTYTLNNPMPIGLKHNGLRPHSFAIDLSTPGGQDFIHTVLANTQDGVAVSLAGHFSGGMRVGLPAIVAVAFDHETLAAML